MNQRVAIGLGLGLLVLACAKEDEHAADAGHAAVAAANVLGADLEQALALGLAQAVEFDAAPSIETWGRVIVDPGARFTLRAPLAGTLHAEHWPTPGVVLAPTENFASIEPRLGAVERVDLAARRADVERDRAKAQSELENAEHTLARSVALNADAKAVSDRALEEARTRVATLRAEIANAVERAGALAVDTGALSATLALPRGGEVLDVFARPAESVDAGAALLELADLSHPLIEVQVPLGARLVGDEATVASLRDGEHAFHAVVETHVASGAPTAGEVLRLRVDAAAPLRPGEPIVARFQAAGAALHGVELPRSSLVRLAGKTWVYVRDGERGFERVEVVLASETRDGWLTTTERVRGAELVVRGAQSLLSTELLARAGGSGGEEE
ncbi:MAG: hypothetical protein K8S98_05640 [Planctomycetes bacterium]|nr:hypothetical protein [Planctomycetota bacterium]